MISMLARVYVIASAPVRCADFASRGEPFEYSRRGKCWPGRRCEAADLLRSSQEKHLGIMMSVFQEVRYLCGSAVGGWQIKGNQWQSVAMAPAHSARPLEEAGGEVELHDGSPPCVWKHDELPWNQLDRASSIPSAHRSERSARCGAEGAAGAAGRVTQAGDDARVVGLHQPTVRASRVRGGLAWSVYTSPQ